MKREAKKPESKKRAAHRVPTQKRAQVTVAAMLDAAVRLLKRVGASLITTNRIAETAGVSIGSVYQYFPNKQAIFIALHERHIDQVDSMIRRCMKEGAEVPIEEFIDLLLCGMIELHQVDPELSALLQAEVPYSDSGTPGLPVRLYEPMRKALGSRARTLRRAGSLDMQAFFISNMVDAFGHAIVLRRPPGLSLARAKAETLRAIQGYFQY
jgi:AcrR family transcriptional regulator